MAGNPFPAAVVTELQRQMNHEYGAAHAYTALAMWCNEQNLKGFSRFFHKQSNEERGHAQRIADHLLDRGMRPELAAIGAPATAFKTLLDVAKKAQNMEQLNTKGIHKAHAAAVKSGDVAAQVMLQWFINEQVEEEQNGTTIVEMLRMVGSQPQGLFMIDSKLGARAAD
jgi:ferritin